MKYGPQNFLYGIKQLVSGSNKPAATGGVPGVDGGFNQDYMLDNGDVVLGTGTTYTTTSNVPILSNAASSTNLTVGTFSYLIPRDYDQASDKLLIRIVAKSAGGTDTPKITVASSTSALGGTVGVAGTSVTSASTSSTLAVYEFDLSGQGLVRDTILSAVITLATHNTDAFQVFFIEIVYASNLVAYTDGVDALGNPLR